MTAIAQTSMIAACLAVLIYIAVITTGNYFATQGNIEEQNPFSQQQQIDDALHQLYPPISTIRIKQTQTEHRRQCSSMV